MLPNTHICANVGIFLVRLKPANMSRLSIDLTAQQHQALKALAALEGKSIKAYAVERLFPVAGTEDQALGELKALLQERLDQAQRGELSARSITEIAAEGIGSDQA
jgi:hypothetical protein